MSILMLAAIYRGGKIVQCSDFKKRVLLKCKITSRRSTSIRLRRRRDQAKRDFLQNRIRWPAFFWLHQGFQYLTWWVLKTGYVGPPWSRFYSTAATFNFPSLAHILDPRQTWCFSAATSDIAARRPIANWIAGHMCRFRWNFIIALHTYFTFKLLYS